MSHRLMPRLIVYLIALNTLLSLFLAKPQTALAQTDRIFKTKYTTVHYKDQKEIELKGIATNVSEGGLFAEFLDLDTPAYSEMQGLEGSRVEVDVPPNEAFKDRMLVPGKINRFELFKKQYGLAIQFV